MKTKPYLSILSVTGLLVLAGCSTPTPEMTSRPNFLSTYNYLKQVDDLHWRYVSPLLGQCNKFIVSPVKVLFNEVNGKPITPEQRQKTANFIQNVIIQNLNDKYPIVYVPGPDVGEIRIALTGAYKTGGKVGLCVQGEILDNSGTQVAAAMRTELSEEYVPDWENKQAAKDIVGEWAERLRKAIDEAHGVK
jgi:hypothetical protein